jgi:hypothetical protein
MTQYKYRELRPTPEAEAILAVAGAPEREFLRHQSFDRRADIVATSCTRCTCRMAVDECVADSELATNVLTSFDPRNITLGGVLRRCGCGEVCGAQAADLVLADVRRSPLGLNHWLGFKFRCMLGNIFKKMGKGGRSSTMWSSRLYNLTIEDLLHDPQERDVGRSHSLHEDERLGLREFTAHA